MREAADLIAPEAGGRSCERLIDLELFRVLQNRHTHSDKSLACNDRLVPHGRVNAEEAIRFDGGAARDHDMRGDHDVILDAAVVANVITAPHNDVASDFNKGLDGVVFEDEAIIAALETGPDGRLGTDIADQLITSVLSFLVFFRARVIHPLEAHWNEHLVTFGWIELLYLVKRHHGKAFIVWLLEELSIEREGNDIVGGIMGQIKVGQLRPLTHSEDYNLCHFRSLFVRCTMTVKVI
jgi:hypothetical protein